MTTQDSAAQESNGLGASQRTPRGDDQSDGENFSEIKDTLARSATDLTTDLRREGQRLMKDATESATSLANEKKSVAADYLRAVAEAAEASCDVLEERGYAGSSRFLTQAVIGLGEFTDSLATRDPSDLLSDAVAYARRNPALFLGAALFAGFGLARLARATTTEESEDHDDDLTADDEAADYADASESAEEGVYAS